MVRRSWPISRSHPGTPGIRGPSTGNLATVYLPDPGLFKAKYLLPFVAMGLAYRPRPAARRRPGIGTGVGTCRRRPAVAPIRINAGQSEAHTGSPGDRGVACFARVRCATLGSDADNDTHLPIA